jgi:hypothetical protein
VDNCDLLRCVDQGLDNFGSNIKSATYSALQVNDDLQPCEIFEFPEAFERALKSVFGDGYVLAERSVVKEIQKKFVIRCVPSSYSVADAFQIARGEIRKSSRNR